MKYYLYRVMRRFRHDNSGIIIIIFALMIVPILLVVGVAMDLSQILVIKRQLVAAADAAALGIARMPDEGGTLTRDRAEGFVRAHYPEESLGALTSVSAVRGAYSVEVSATAEIETSVLRLVGYDRLSVTASSQAMSRQAKLEVVMVLDNTGSMNDYAGSTRKIDALRSAASTLVGILFGTAQESPYVKIGLVPFANAVNVGTGFRGSGMMDEALPTALNTEQVLKETGDGYTHLFQVFSELGRSWGGCVRARLGGHDLDDAAPTSADRATLFTPYLAPDETDWTGANSYLTDPSNAGKYRKYAFYRDNPNWSGSGAGPNYNCPSAPILPLTNVRSTITAALSAMQARGSTVIPEGLAWGWRVVSPGPPFTQGVAYDAPETQKVIVLLTDGRNDVNGGGNGNYKSYFTAYGHADNGHLGATSGAAAEATLNTKLSTLCQTIKADKDGDASDRDIVIYTIGFDIAAGSTIDGVMRGCASDPGKFFNTPSAQELRAAFENIALGLAGLRLTR